MNRNPNTSLALAALRPAAFLAAASFLPATVLCAAEESSAAEQAKLAMELNNPVTALISLPLQSNWDFGIGENDAYQYKLNVHPVIPITLNEDWNIISRTILPVIDAESPAPGIDDVSGLGNSTQSFFLSPEKKTPLIHRIGRERIGKLDSDHFSLTFRSIHPAMLA